MPRTSLEEARAWRAENAKEPIGCKSGGGVSLPLVDLAGFDEGDKAYTDQAALNRAIYHEKIASDLVETAIKSGNPIAIRSALDIHANTQKIRSKAKQDYLDLQAKEGALVEVSWVIKRDSAIFAAINLLIDQLPDNISAEVLMEAEEKEKLQKVTEGFRSDILKKLEGLPVE